MASVPIPSILPRRMRLRGLAVVLAVVTVAASGTPVAAWSANSYSPSDESLLFALTNQARASAGLRSLSNDSYLVGLARWRSKDLITRNYFSHTILGTNYMVFTVMSQQGYCFKVAGENIGSSSYPDDSATVNIQAGFMASPEHRSNILGNWNVMGVGAYQGSSGNKMYTVLFAQRCSAPVTNATPRPTVRATPRPTVRATPRPTARPVTPVATAKPTAKATTKPKPTPTASPTSTLTPTASPMPTPLPTPAASPTPTPPPTASPPADVTPAAQPASLRVRPSASSQGLLGSVFQLLFGGLPAL